MNKSLSIFNQLRPFTVGYDNVFDRFESMFDNDHFFSTTSNYPPYNIVKTGDYTYDIELALAGFGKKDIDVNYADSQLTIKSIKDEKAEEDADGVLHKGISKRQFSRTFTIADDVEVKGAELKDGLLKVSLEKIIPDSKKPRTIQIK
jgi:molecular chaperone IbpA|tara:strand:- start:243 stop:683 length:441 start_codon:yes stop_codon:yes gene_type:complete